MATPDIRTPEVISLVNAYLMARAHAEVMREKVDEVYREILTECPVYADRYDRTQQILKVGDLYLCSNDALCQDVYEEGNKRLRARKIKPAEMPDDYCPALVAENLQVKTENMLIEAAGAPFGITNERLLCAGLEKRQQFIDLVVKMVVSMPGFRNPLTGKAP